MNLMLVWRAVVGKDAAQRIRSVLLAPADAVGLEAHDLPFAEPSIVDARVAVLSADVAIIAGADHLGAGGDDGGVSVDMNLGVAGIDLGDLHCAGATYGKRIGLGFKRTAGSYSQVVIGQQTIEDGDVVMDESLTPLRLEGFNLLTEMIIAVRNREDFGVAWGGRTGAEQEQEKESPPPWHGRTSLHKKRHKPMDGSLARKVQSKGCSERRVTHVQVLI